MGRRGGGGNSCEEKGYWEGGGIRLRHRQLLTVTILHTHTVLLTLQKALIIDRDTKKPP